MDLDAVTSAIDRLYLVTPQLHNQRVELKQRKVEELERAKHARPKSAEGKGKGKGKNRDTQELDTLLGMIGRASARRLNDQAVVVSEEMRMRMELARQRDAVKVSILLSRRM
jgi:ubiquitin-protein ligase E3 D